MKLKIFDSYGKELKLNDLVEVQNNKNENLTFITRVQIIGGQLFPFNKFAFDRIIFCESLPDNCKHVPAKDSMPEYWINSNLELKLIDQGKLEKWKVDCFSFINNQFLKVYE